VSTHAQSPTGKNSAPFESWPSILRDSVKEVFSMMVGAEILVPDQADPPIVTEVTGMVGLAGELCGVLSVRCGKDCATKIASKMLGVPVTEAASNMTDAIGEICNMVAGNFKAKLDGVQDKCMLSVPTIITGGDYQFSSLAASERIELPFLFDGESVWIALEVRS
jgi:chemotaxis protein CheX